MPQYKVTAPNGQVLYVDAPVGASEQEVIDKAKDLYNSVHGTGAYDSADEGQDAFNYIEKNSNANSIESKDTIREADPIGLIALLIIAVFLIFLYRNRRRKSKSINSDVAEKVKRPKRHQGVSGVVLLILSGLLFLQSESVSQDQWWIYFWSGVGASVIGFSYLRLALVNSKTYRRWTEWWVENRENFFKLLVGIPIALFIVYWLVTAPSCSLTTQWRGSVFPDKSDKSDEVTLGEFGTLEACREAATDLIQRSNFYDPDYYCAANCEWQSEGYYLCERKER